MTMATTDQHTETIDRLAYRAGVSASDVGRVARELAVRPMRMERMAVFGGADLTRLEKALRRAVQSGEITPVEGRARRVWCRLAAEIVACDALGVEWRGLKLDGPPCQWRLNRRMGTDADEVYRRSVVFWTGNVAIIDDLDDTDVARVEGLACQDYVELQALRWLTAHESRTYREWVDREAWNEARSIYDGNAELIARIAERLPAVGHRFDADVLAELRHG